MAGEVVGRVGGRVGARVGGRKVIDASFGDKVTDAPEGIVNLPVDFFLEASHGEGRAAVRRDG